VYWINARGIDALRKVMRARWQPAIDLTDVGAQLAIAGSVNAYAEPTIPQHAHRRIRNGRRRATVDGIAFIDDRHGCNVAKALGVATAQTLDLIDAAVLWASRGRMR